MHHCLDFKWPSWVRRRLGTFGWIPLRHYLCIFSILILTRFYILYLNVPVLLKCFTTCSLKSQIWSTKMWIALEQLNLINAFQKFSLIIKLTGTFCCVCTVLYSAYNCQGVSAWGYKSFPYIRPPLTRQDNEIEPATYDSLTNIRNQWSIGALQAPPVNIAYLLTFWCYMF